MLCFSWGTLIKPFFVSDTLIIIKVSLIYFAEVPSWVAFLKYGWLISTKTLCGTLSAIYLELLPQCGFLAQIYLLAPLQNAVVKRTFSLQNILLTQRRNQMLLATVGKKVLLKYCTFFDEENEKLIKSAAYTWCSTKIRRKSTRHI